MNELSLHILDIVQNSIGADAKHIVIEVSEDKELDRLCITVSDDGRGMAPDFLSKVTDPFITTRTTRKVGLGIPLVKLAAESTGGSLSIESELGKGTTVKTVFTLSHIDRAPLGDMAETMAVLLTANPEVGFLYRRRVGQREFVLDTAQMKAEVGDIPLNNPEVLLWVKEYIAEKEKELNGGA